MKILNEKSLQWDFQLFFSKKQNPEKKRFTPDDSITGKPMEKQF